MIVVAVDDWISAVAARLGSEGREAIRGQVRQHLAEAGAGEPLEPVPGVLHPVEESAIPPKQDDQSREVMARPSPARVPRWAVSLTSSRRPAGSTTRVMDALARRNDQIARAAARASRRGRSR